MWTVLSEPTKQKDGSIIPRISGKKILWIPGTAWKNWKNSYKRLKCMAPMESVSVSGYMEHITHRNQVWKANRRLRSLLPGEKTKDKDLLYSETYISTKMGRTTSWLITQ